MLKQLVIENLGCFKDHSYSIDFSPLTVIVGPNNSGKSMAFVGLNLLKYLAFYERIRWNNEFFLVQSFKNIVHSHDVGRMICVSVLFDSKSYKLEVGAKNVSFFVDGQLAKPKGAYENLFKIWYVRPNRILIPFSSDVVYSGLPHQRLSPDGSNVLTYLLERYTEQNERWPLMSEWLQKIDQNISNILMPVRGDQTFFENMVGNVPINLSCMGSGIQSILTVLGATIFSPIGSTIIIEEPEVFLHPRSQEFIVDLFNYLVKHQSKQIIFSTHSWSMILPYIKDIVRKENRGPEHEPTDSNGFKTVVFDLDGDDITIEPYDFTGKTYHQVRDHFKGLWG